MSIKKINAKTITAQFIGPLPIIWLVFRRSGVKIDILWSGFARTELVTRIRMI
jgi:hypothetical protein